jgi:hypothetical protein
MPTYKAPVFQKDLQNGGVYIFVTTDQHFSKTDISHCCKEQVFEICEIQLLTKISNLIIISLYKTPPGDFNGFLSRLCATIKYLYSKKSEFMIWGDINMIYVNENNQSTSKFFTTKHTKCDRRCEFCNKSSKFHEYSQLIIIL